MKIVIDIEEEDFEIMKHNIAANNPLCPLSQEEMVSKVAKGIPLPKCKDCKWWKDSDGVYRRGVGAESKCPINNVSVNHGLGYCYMYEPLESKTETDSEIAKSFTEDVESVKDLLSINDVSLADYVKENYIDKKSGEVALIW